MPLPNEIWLDIFRQLPPMELHRDVSAVCRKWRRLIDSHSKTLPKIVGRCWVYAVIKETGMAPALNFEFSIFENKIHRGIDDYQKGRRRRLLVTVDRQQGVRGEWAPTAFTSYSNLCVSFLEVQRILARFEVRAIRFDSFNRQAELLEDDVSIRYSLNFLNITVGAMNVVSIGFMDLWSGNWRLSSDSMALLMNFSPRSIHINGFRDLTAFNDDWLIGMDLNRLTTLRLFTADDGLQVIAVPISVSILLHLLNISTSRFCLDVFKNNPVFTVQLTASDLCRFLKQWSEHRPVWYFLSIVFNAVFHIDQFRTACLTNELMNSVVFEIPYYRFRVLHNECKQVAIYIDYHSNQISSTWTLRIKDDR